MILEKAKKQPALYGLAVLGAIFIVVLFTSLYWPPKEVIKEVEVPVTVYVDKVEYRNMNVFLRRLEINDLLIKLKDYPDDYERILSFYDGYTHNREISETIIKYSLQYNQPVNYCFGLAQRESQFDPRAYNKNSPTSIDRGLFQLNNNRKSWTVADYYNIDKNAKEAISCLAWLSTVIEDENLSLAAYNTGYDRIRTQSKIPFSTLVHVFKARDNELNFDIQFNTKLLPTLTHLRIEPRK